MHLLSLKYLTYLLIWGIFMHNGTGKTSVSFIYPMKNLNEPFLPYESLLDNTILLISTLSVLIGFHFYEMHFLI